MNWEQRLKNDYWSAAKKDNFKDESVHKITLVLGWFLRTILAGIKAMLTALIDAIKLILHF
jgi:hypothetical protein